MKERKGFTLIEIMIVVVIVGILAALAIPRYIAAARKTKISEARIMLKNIYRAAQTYYAEWGICPRQGGWWMFNNAMTKNTNWNELPGFKLERPSGYPRFTYVLLPQWDGTRWRFRAGAWGYSPDSYDHQMIKVNDLHIDYNGVITGGTPR